jgi:ABC-type sugar transport system ATPase subunit
MRDVPCLMRWLARRHHRARAGDDARHHEFRSMRALKGVDVLIYPGEVCTIVGGNAGKSTLIVAAGVARRFSAIYYDGKYVGAPDPRQLREASRSCTSIRRWR